jgi:flagellar hook assembly protein FlgD
MPQEGLWIYDSVQWEHLSPGAPFYGQGVSRLAINPALQDQLIIGTTGTGCWKTVTGGSSGKNPDLPPGGGFKIKLNQINTIGGAATVQFDLSHPSRVCLKVYDLRGRLVNRVSDELFQAGQHQVTWNGRDSQNRRCASGLYIARLEARGQKATKKFLIVK